MALRLVPRPTLTVEPITEEDMPAVAEFLHANLNDRVPVEAWVRAVDVPWAVERPNAGFMLLEDDVVVGAHLAYYSERVIDGRRERFCNLGAWCVLPPFRLQALQLLRALLAQEDYHFVDLSPSGNVVGLNRRLGFRFLDTGCTLIPNLPWPPAPWRRSISADPSVLERTLTGEDLELYRDHATTAAARHLVLRRGDQWCYVIFRKDRRRGLPVFGSILHVSNPALFRRMIRPLGAHLLTHHGALATLIDHAVLECRPPLSRTFDSLRPKMFHSPALEAAHIDYLYSELTCLSW